jgi:DNA-binding NtrC family response regulator
MRLLLVEDKDSFRRLLVQALAGSAWDVTAVGDPAQALAVLAEAPFEVLVTDLRLPGMSGLELLKAAKRSRPALRAVLMSAFGEPGDIVEAMRWGADDFLPKPFDLDRFAEVLERLRALVEAPPPDPREPWIVQAPAMRELDQALAKAAQTSFPVLFQGEPGSGKRRAARRLHALRHPQAPFLCLSASSLSPAGPDERRMALLQGGSLLVSDLEDLG